MNVFTLFNFNIIKIKNNSYLMALIVINCDRCIRCDFRCILDTCYTLIYHIHIMEYVHMLALRHIVVPL
jgi:hypothetical protein